jgi:hypothetical protein
LLKSKTILFLEFIFSPFLFVSPRTNFVPRLIHLIRYEWHSCSRSISPLHVTPDIKLNWLTNLCKEVEQLFHDSLRLTYGSRNCSRWEAYKTKTMASPIFIPCYYTYVGSYKLRSYFILFVKTGQYISWVNCGETFTDTALIYPSVVMDVQLVWVHSAYLL